jgi:hypothetical protein
MPFGRSMTKSQYVPKEFLVLILCDFQHWNEDRSPKKRTNKIDMIYPIKNPSANPTRIRTVTDAWILISLYKKNKRIDQFDARHSKWFKKINECTLLQLKQVKLERKEVPHYKEVMWTNFGLFYRFPL